MPIDEEKKLILPAEKDITRRTRIEQKKDRDNTPVPEDEYEVPEPAQEKSSSKPDKEKVFAALKKELEKLQGKERS